MVREPLTEDRLKRPVKDVSDRDVTRKESTQYGTQGMCIYIRADSEQRSFCCLSFEDVMAQSGCSLSKVLIPRLKETYSLSVSMTSGP